MTVSDSGNLPTAVQGAAILEPRRMLWSDSSSDIRALRRMVRDGPLSVTPSAAPLFVESLTAAAVHNDTSGNVRLSSNVVSDSTQAATTWRLPSCWALARGIGPCRRRASKSRGPWDTRLSRWHRKTISSRPFGRIRRRVFRRDNWRCRPCGRRGRLQVDHIQPLHRGGASDGARKSPIDLRRLSPRQDGG